MKMKRILYILSQNNEHKGEIQRVPEEQKGVSYPKHNENNVNFLLTLLLTLMLGRSSNV